MLFEKLVEFGLVSSKTCGRDETNRDRQDRDRQRSSTCTGVQMWRKGNSALATWCLRRNCFSPYSFYGEPNSKKPMVGWWPFERLTYRLQEAEPGAKEGRGEPDCPLGGSWFHRGVGGWLQRKGEVDFQVDFLRYRNGPVDLGQRVGEITLLAFPRSPRDWL